MFSKENSPPVIYQDVWSNSQTNHYLIYISLIVLGLPNSKAVLPALWWRSTVLVRTDFQFRFRFQWRNGAVSRKIFFFYWPFEKLFSDINNYGRINFAHDKLIQGWFCLPHRTKKWVINTGRTYDFLATSLGVDDSSEPQKAFLPFMVSLRLSVPLINNSY